MKHKFNHFIQIAHRLSETFPGSKCENIHGHSLHVYLTLHGEYHNGVMHNLDEKPLEFGDVKKNFRGYLDDNYDHRLLLNRTDPWAQPIFQLNSAQESGSSDVLLVDPDVQKFLPGLQIIEGDPTTERLSALWCERFAQMFRVRQADVFIQETATNGVGATAHINMFPNLGTNNWNWTVN